MRDLENIVNKLQGDALRKHDAKVEELREHLYGYIDGTQDLLEYIKQNKRGGVDVDQIKHCPKCGAGIGMRYEDGTAECDGCGYRFRVVECEEE